MWLLDREYNCRVGQAPGTIRLLERMMKMHLKFAAALSAIMLCSLTMVLQGVLADSGPQKVGLIGKVSAIEGQLLRYVPQEQDWVLMVKDTPFGFDDALASGENGRAEIINPNNTVLRIGSNTVIHLIKLEDDFTEIDISTGVLRLYNRSSSLLMKITTPFGYVVAHPESALDVYAGPESVEVFSLQGKAEYVTAAEDSRYELSIGSPIMTDGVHVVAGADTIDLRWDGWNSERNNLMLARLEVKGASVELLPQSLRNEAYSLEENGAWEEVYSESCNCKERLWRPTRVSAGWRPFTSGRWVEMYAENCWVPDEPFGYVTHHYGNWELIDGKWYWAPPAKQPQPAVVTADEAPAPTIQAAWYPGRVGWFYSETQIGWFPLAPREPFHAVNYWGPQAVVANEAGIENAELPSYAYYEAGGVVVEQSSFYHVENYTRTRITNINAMDPNARRYNRVRLASVPKPVASDKSRFSAGSSSSAQSKPAQPLTSRILRTKANASVSSSSAKSTISALQAAKPAQSASSAVRHPESVGRSPNRAQPGQINSPRRFSTSNSPVHVENSIANTSAKKVGLEKTRSRPTPPIFGKTDKRSAGRASGRKNTSSASGTAGGSVASTRGTNMRKTGGANVQRNTMPKFSAPKTADPSIKKQ